MHEHIFIQKIIEQIPDKEKVISVEVELGELAGIDSEHLREHLSKETNWNVKVVVNKSKIKCSCGYCGEVRILQRVHDFVIYECPRCENDNPKVLTGKDIKITKVIYR